MLSKSKVERLKGFETPYYFYDCDLLRETLREAVQKASEHGYIIHFAIKANFDPRVLEIIRSFGIGVDCVSEGEVRMALQAGFPADKIVMAGVGKKDREMNYAIENNIFAINCESIEEMQVLEELAARQDKVVDVALRVNPDIDPRTNHHIDTGHADTKFGMSSSEIVDNAQLLLSLKHLNIHGLHIHVGSQIRDMHVFEQLCTRMNALIDDLSTYGFNFDFVDLGGGLGINYDVPEEEPVPNFAGLFNTVARCLKPMGCAVHFELGRALVAQCAELITTVLYNKTTATGRRLVICDASMTELVRPAMYGAYHNIENISSLSPRTEKYTVVGTCCESTDVFDENIDLKITRRGDLLSIKSAGAYGMSMASCYNGHPLPGAVYSDDL